MTTIDNLLDGRTAAPAVPRRRIRGLRVTAVPSWPLVAQFGGAAATHLGVYLAWGVAATLILAGVSAVALGALREGGKI